jgi:hypothetical protein
VPADGVVVGRLFKLNAAPVGIPWMWTLEVEHCGDRRPTYGYAATRDAAMAAFAKSWRRSKESPGCAEAFKEANRFDLGRNIT